MVGAEKNPAEFKKLREQPRKQPITSKTSGMASGTSKKLDTPFSEIHARLCVEHDTQDYMSLWVYQNCMADPHNSYPI